MVTLGWSYTKSIVIVFKDKEVQDYVLNWLVTTDVKQVYHNALFDVSHILYHTKKMPKYIEDTQLLAKVYKNHVNPEKRKTGLKILAKDLYQDWAEDKSSFDLYVDSSNYKNENMRYYGSSKNISQYNLPLIYYSAVDSAATYAVYQKFDIEEPNPKEWVFPTSEPRYNEEQFNQRHYYEFILKPAIPVIVKMMAAGQTIDLDKVKDMKQNVEAMKEDMIQKISNVPRVKEFHDKTDAARINAFLEPVRKSLVSPKYGPYKNDVATRTFVVNYWTGLNLEKVSAKDLKTMDYPICKLLDNKEFTHKDVVEAVNAYAEHKANTLNIRNNRIDKLENPRKYLEGSLGFNPFNYSQNTRLWQYLGLESEEVSKKTGEMSFSKTVLKQLAKTTKDDEVRFVLESYLEIAEAKNIITQYIPKYLESTIDGRVYGNIVMLGTLSGRLSGKSEKSTDESIKHKKGINLVTQPSSSSAFAKPVKQLFTAAKGKILASSDFTNLEGYCGALLTKDETSLRNLRLNFDT
jgi:DNA polymerase I-like protein with 3'-5' exonuclease and polymerase domains